MHAHEISIEVPSPGARRATEEGSKNGWKKVERFAARQQTEVVLRLLRGEALDLLSRELGLPAARLATWREVCLDAGQEALKKPPLDSRDQEIGRLALHWPVVWSGACLPRVGCGPAPPSPGNDTSPLRLAPGGGPLVPVRMTSWWTTSGASWRPRPSQAKGIARCGHSCGIAGSAPRHVGSCV